MKNWFKLGDWNAVCDVCGRRFKASSLLDRWDGLKVCTDDFETRHPQDLIKGPKGDKPLPWSRPEAPDEFITVTYVASTVGVQDNTVPTGTFNTDTL